MQIDDLAHALSAIGGNNDFIRTVLSAFELMDVAEQEIQRAMKRHPEKRCLLYGSFQTIRNHMPMTPKLYRQHARELLERIATGQDYKRATRAEVLTTLTRISMAAPLQSSPTALYTKLFKELFPEDAEKLELNSIPLHERYAGELQQMFAEFVRKLTQDRAAPYELTPYEDKDESVEKTVQLPLFEEIAS